MPWWARTFLLRPLLRDTMRPERRRADVADAERLEHGGDDILEVVVAAEALAAVEDQLGLPLGDAADQLAEIAAEADEMDVVAVLAERVSDLVLHLRLGDVDASRELVVHLLDVLVMTPSGGIGRIEDDGDAEWH